MDGVRAVLDAIEVFFENLTAVDPQPLALAVLCHLAKLLAITRAWRNIIADAYPEQRVRWRPLFGAYVAGVGINAIVPARGGDVVKLYLARRAVPGSTYTTLTSTLLVQSIFDTVAASILLLWAVHLGVLPGLDVLPALPSFDFSWFFAHPQAAAAFLVALFVGLVFLAIWLEQHVTAFRARVAQGIRVLHDRPRYLRRVALWQAVDWALRIATVYFFLLAFDVHADLHNALLGQVANSLSTILPISPGGIGTEQALIVYVLSGEAASSALLSLSVGMRLTLTVFNVALGFAALFLMLRTFRFRRLVASERAPARP
jgi:glycosyltransferase 2 family protein